MARSAKHWHALWSPSGGVPPPFISPVTAVMPHHTDQHAGIVTRSKARCQGIMVTRSCASYDVRCWSLLDFLSANRVIAPCVFFLPELVTVVPLAGLSKVKGEVTSSCYWQIRCVTAAVVYRYNGGRLGTPESKQTYRHGGPHPTSPPTRNPNVVWSSRRFFDSALTMDRVFLSVLNQHSPLEQLSTW